MKVGTVFSGIGAIEHALLRMNLEHKLMFACDNGDVDIFSHKLLVDINIVDKEFADLNAYLASAKNSENANVPAVSELNKDIKRDIQIYDEVHNALSEVECAPNIEGVLSKIIEQKAIKESRKREYKKFLSDLKSENNRCAKILKALQYTVECVNDFKNDNALEILETK